jgi:pyruvate dehydrogenase E1 component alpha subunit
MAQDVVRTIAPGVDPFSVIERDGRLSIPQGADFGAPIDELTRRLYADMFLARRLDREAFALQRQGELALWLLCQGQEAAQVGSIRALRDSDFVFPSYREHAVTLCRGVTPTELLPLWRGTSHGGWDPVAHRLHIYTLVLSTQMLHAVGYAMGVKLDRAAAPNDEIVMAYVGDGATSEGDASEALNWAAVTQAPIIFFCQNNQWAISTPNPKQFKGSLHQRARGFGLDVWHVDGNDALAVYLVVRDAAEHVRNGGGPVFIEAATYRIGGHSTSDDPRRYRSDLEVEEWTARDPIDRLRRVLDAEGWADPTFHAALEVAADALGTELRDACHSLDSGSLSTVFRNTLVRETRELALERQAFEDFQGSFA